ncbi:hypothetical protein M6B38_117510 [Iris pallida]|uniref:Uncharacterized protein n=1 Tax=Iris pallida TaxID=29817 RepID=A0AAX6HU37_IRIPA|nr:hypothetical protein M6B38_117510 [Iris pallida]
MLAPRLLHRCRHSCKVDIVNFTSLFPIFLDKASELKDICPTYYGPELETLAEQDGATIKDLGVALDI